MKLLRSARRAASAPLALASLGLGALLAVAPVAPARAQAPARAVPDSVADRQSEAALRRQLAADPADAATRWELVQLLASDQRWAAALDALRPFAGDSLARRTAARLYSNEGVAAYRAGRKAEARVDWAQALNEDPTLAAAAGNLAASLLEVGRRDSARTVATRALRYTPGDARLLAIRAATLGGEAGLRAAVRAARAARTERPADEAIGLELAQLLEATDRAGAAALFDTLVSAPHPSEATYRAAASFWLDAGRLDVAAARADSGLARYPRSGPLWTLRGEADAERKQWPQAAEAYRHAEELLPDPDAAELPLMDAYAAEADTASALAVFRRMADGHSPRDALLQGAARAVALGGSGAPDSAYRRLLAVAPRSVSVLDDAAALAERTTDTTRAVALYRRALAEDSSGPAAPLALLHLTRPASDSTRQHLLRLALWRGATALQTAELAATNALSGPVTPGRVAAARPLLSRREQLVADIEAALDTVVLHTAWGPAELTQLRLAYPGSTLFDRYAARLDAQRGDNSAALALYDGLLRRDATDAEVQQDRAAILERMARDSDAVMGYARAFELLPGDSASFRALVRLQDRAGRLTELLDQVQRLRLRMPASRALAVDEIELLQRLGRLAEATAAARALQQAEQEKRR